MKQLSVFLENKKGELTKLTEILNTAKISIDSVVIAETSNFGVVRIITKDYEKALNILKMEGFSARIIDVVAVLIENKRGAFHKIAQVLSCENININYCYNFYSDENKGTFIFSLDDNQKGEIALKNANFELL